MTSAQFSEDSRHLVTASDDGRLILWDVEERIEKSRLEHGAALKGLSQHPDGQQLATVDSEGQIHVWSLPGLELIARPLMDREERPRQIAFSPSGDVLAIGDSLGRIELVQVEGWRPLGGAIEACAGGVTTIEFSPVEPHLACGGQQGQVEIWQLPSEDDDRASLVARAVLGGSQRGGVWDVTYRPDGQTLAATGRDNRLFLWDIREAPPKGSLLGSSGSRALAFSRNGDVLAAAGADGSLVYWDVENVAASDRLGGHAKGLRTVAFSPDGRFIVTGGSDNTVVLRDFAGREISGAHALSETHYVHKDPVLSLAHHPTRRMFASADRFGLIQLWNSETGERMGDQIRTNLGSIWDLSFSHDGEYLVSGGQDPRIGIWRILRDGSLRLDHLVETPTRVTSVQFAPQGRMIAAGTAGSSILLVDASIGQVTGQLSSQQLAAAHSLDFRPSSTQLMAAGLVWQQEELRTGAVILDLERAQKPTISSFVLDSGSIPVQVARFSPDGEILALGDSDGAIELWDPESTLRAREPLRGHHGVIRDLTFLSSTLLASAADDGNVNVWSLQDSSPLMVLSMPERRQILSLAASPDGNTLASGGRDGSVVVFDLRFESWRELGCRIANRNLSSLEFRAHLGPTLGYRKTCPELAPGEAVTTVDLTPARRRGLSAALKRLFLKPDSDSSAETATQQPLDTLRDATEEMRRPQQPFHIDDMFGTWTVTYDPGAPFAEQWEYQLDSSTVLEFNLVVAEDRSMTFEDDEHCEHWGRLSAADEAYGSYRCPAEPGYTGRWIAERRRSE